MKLGDVIVGRMYYQVGDKKSRYIPKEGFEKIPINDQIIIAYGYHGRIRGYDHIVFQNQEGHELAFNLDHIPIPSY